MTIEALEVRAFAKINLFLDVTGKRDDGYHTVDMVMQSVDYSDRLIFKIKDGAEDMLTVGDGGDPGRFPLPDAGEDNLVLRAVRVLRERYARRFPADTGLDIRLEKSIPSEAGLGGGSADAAATLIAVNQLFGLALTDGELFDAALSLGADVPFCLRGGTMRARGIGEELKRLPAMPDCSILIVKPRGGASTKAIYEAIDGEEIEHPDMGAMEMALEKNDIAAVSSCLANVMEPVTAKYVPSVEKIVDFLIREGAFGARMTGSGSAVFGLFTDEGEAFEVMRRLNAAAGELDIQDIMMTKPISEKEIRDIRIMPHIDEKFIKKYGKKQLAASVSVRTETASETGSSLHEENIGGLAVIGGDDRIRKVYFDMSGTEPVSASENELVIGEDGKSAELRRSGAVSQTLRFNSGETTDAEMSTPYGRIALSLKTDRLDIVSDDSELRLTAEYRFAETPEEKHSLSIEVRGCAI